MHVCARGVCGQGCPGGLLLAGRCVDGRTMGELLLHSQLPAAAAVVFAAPALAQTAAAASQMATFADQLYAALQRSARHRHVRVTVARGVAVADPTSVGELPVRVARRSKEAALLAAYDRAWEQLAARHRLPDLAQLRANAASVGAYAAALWRQPFFHQFLALLVQRGRDEGLFVRRCAGDMYSVPRAATQRTRGGCVVVPDPLADPAAALVRGVCWAAVVGGGCSLATWSLPYRTRAPCM